MIRYEKCMWEKFAVLIMHLSYCCRCYCITVWVMHVVCTSPAQVVRMCRLLCLTWKYRFGKECRYSVHVWYACSCKSEQLLYSVCSLFTLNCSKWMLPANHTGWAFAPAATDSWTVDLNYTFNWAAHWTACKCATYLGILLALQLLLSWCCQCSEPAACRSQHPAHSTARQRLMRLCIGGVKYKTANSRKGRKRQKRC